MGFTLGTNAALACLPETNFASKAAVLAVTVAALALKVFCLYDLKSKRRP